MRSRILTLLIPAVLILPALPGTAFANAAAVQRDCADNGVLDKKHSKADLKKAKSSLPSDLDEYTDCRAAINKGLAASASASSNDGSPSGGSGSGGSGGGGPTANAAANGAPADAAGSAPGGGANAGGAKGAVKGAALPAPAKPSLVVAGQTIEPGKNGLFQSSEAANGLPLPILLALIAVGLLTAAGGYLVMKRRGIAPGAALRLLRR